MTTIRHSAGFLGEPAPLYFDRLVPEGDRRRPWVVMVHGGSHTGSCYLLTADGRPGWAHHFAERGFPVAVPDWPGHGRSGGALLEEITGELVAEALAALVDTLDGDVVMLTHSMGAAYGWRVAELRRDRIRHVVAVAPAAPGNLAPAARIVEEDPDGLTVHNGARAMKIPRHGYSRAATEMIEGKLIGTGTRFPDSTRKRYRNLISPTAARLVRERMNVERSQVSVRDPSRLAGLEITVLTGSHDIDHPREVDQELVDWLAANGALAEFVWLPDSGIEGNGHMVMLESNSAQVADLIIGRLS